MQTGNSRKPDRGVLITEASLKAAELLGVSDSEFARIIGVSEGTISSWKRGKGNLVAGSEQYRTALLFIRAFRSLYSIVGDDAVAQAWMRSTNNPLGSCPIDLMATPEGLTNVTKYLDANRAPI